MKYRKKPVVIEAVQFLGFDGEICLSSRPQWVADACGVTIIFFGDKDTLTIKTLEGDMTANVGDFIIKGVQGELYPCKPEIFEQTYEAV